jgi:hypothetical protein
MANYYNNKGYNTKPKYLSKGVVLCQSGLFCSNDTFNPMWNQLRSIADLTTIDVNDEVLTEENVNTLEIQNALIRQSKIAKLSFFKTLFKNKIGRIDDQVEELNKIIQSVKNVFGKSTPIFLVGYSKGGLVNMRFVTLYPGLVENVISIGTPYLNSYIQKILSMVDDVLAAPLYTIVGDKFVDINNGIRKLVNTYLHDEDLGSDTFFEKLKMEWNSLSSNLKPYYTCIACSQVGFTSNPEDGCDMIVSVEAQKGIGLNDINERILIDDNYEYLIRDKWYDYLYMNSSAMNIEKSENIIWGASQFFQGDYLGCLFALVLSAIPYTWDLSKYDLLHTRELGNINVCKAVLSAINKSNKN